MNHVLITGNICADIELRFIASGTAVANFNVAVSRRWVQNGEKKEETSFIGVACFGKQAETIAQYFRKGSPILVSGRLKQESWDGKDGKKQSKTVVVLEGFEFMERSGSKTGGEAPQPRPAAKTTPSSAAKATAAEDDQSEVPF